MPRFLLVAALALVSWRISPAEEIMAVSEVPDRNRILGDMAGIIAGSIVRSDTGHPVFHGCYDWHSSVHGHWALLRVARGTGGHKKQAFLVERALSAGGIAREADYLRARPEFEMPYGRAWFLRLAVEFERWALQNQAGDPQRLRATADEVAESILAAYERDGPDPHAREYRNGSWALVQLHAYARHLGHEGFRRRTETLISRHMLHPQTPPSFAADSTRSDFFSTFGNWAYLIVKTQPPQVVDDFRQTHRLSDLDIRPVPLRPAAHHLGMTWSRAWALRALSRAATDSSSRKRLDQAFLNHVQTGMRQHAAHAGNYATYDHWVPQFAVYAITE